MGFEPLDGKYYGWLLSGWMTTLWLALVVVLAGTAVGCFVATARSSASRGKTGAARIYVSALRNTPLLVQLFFWYFGVAASLPQSLRTWLNASHTLELHTTVILRWPSFEILCALVGLTLYASAYIGEEIRSGMRGVPSAQREAAMSLELSRWQTMRLVIWPQAFSIAAPALLGQYMNTIKNTSLTMAVGVVELSAAARQVEADTFRTFHAFAVATALYVATIAMVNLLGHKVLQRQASRRVER